MSNSAACRESLTYEMSAFVFVGGYTSLTPTQITAHLGIEPRMTSDTPLKQGAKRPPGWKTWLYKPAGTGRLAVNTIDDLIHTLLGEIESQAERFQTLPNDCEKEVVVTIFSDDLRPHAELSADTITLLGKFGLSLRIAFYCGSDED